MKLNETSRSRSPRDGDPVDHPKRSYRKTTRAETERATGEAIVLAALSAFSSKPFDRVTLQSVAGEAGVTVQTVIRRFGSKEGLFEHLTERETARVLASRDVDPHMGFAAALEALLNHYETDGDIMLNFIAQEHLFEPIHRIVENGRRIHRQWVERHCEEILSGSSGAKRERLLHAAIVSTDLSTWKLLRRDLRLDLSEAKAIISHLLDGLKGRK